MVKKIQKLANVVGERPLTRKHFLPFHSSYLKIFPFIITTLILYNLASTLAIVIISIAGHFRHGVVMQGPLHLALVMREPPCNIVKEPKPQTQQTKQTSQFEKVSALKLLSLIWQKLSKQNFLRNSSRNVPDTQVKWMKKTKAIAFVNRLLPFSQDYYLIC